MLDSLRRALDAFARSFDPERIRRLRVDLDALLTRLRENAQRLAALERRMRAPRRWPPASTSLPFGGPPPRPAWPTSLRAFM